VNTNEDRSLGAREGNKPLKNVALDSTIVISLSPERPVGIRVHSRHLV
jgi:hypothetical protein